MKMEREVGADREPPHFFNYVHNFGQVDWLSARFFSSEVNFNKFSFFIIIFGIFLNNLARTKVTTPIFTF